ncbi:unnamed protein product [Arabidopsis thaliana]|uniref:F-box domain-containing protein n=1 Tax=Arabidopsis thaliana TaxID=3702 RepID=A0A5S9XUD8_ARATH|nr:unnamed protein product [Arabidopsis thaliana]
MDRREEEEEETGYGEKGTRNQSKEDESRLGKIFELIPLDMIPDILLRLPAKSAVRFRIVSKLWLSITTRPYFIRSFAFPSSTRLCLMACVKARDMRLFISLHQHDDGSYAHVDRCEIKSPKHDYYNPSSESVNGLVCFGDFYNIVVWNPSMRQHVTLPEPKPHSTVRYFIRSCLGYDPVEDKYKVLSISGYHNGNHDPLVFTLGPQESWRVIQNSPLDIPLPTGGSRVGTCINGHVYYEAQIRFKVDDIFNFENILMSFDVRVMLTGVTHDTGEFIFINATMCDAFCVLYYDPKSGSERRIEYEGIGDREFCINTGILECKRFTIDWFPNHNESLMSLVNVLKKAD